MGEGAKLVNIDFTMAIQIINFLILVFVFKRFFSKKIGKVIEDRKKLALSEMETVREEIEKLEEQKKSINKIRIESKRRANDILIKSEEQADMKKELIISSAILNRERMMMKAENDIEKMRQNAKVELEKEMGKIAVEIAEKLLNENTKYKQNDLIDNFIDQI